VVPTLVSGSRTFSQRMASLAVALRATIVFLEPFFFGSRRKAVYVDGDFGQLPTDVVAGNGRGNRSLRALGTGSSSTPRTSSRFSVLIIPLRRGAHRK